ncbi:hypothetical protein MUO32_17965 [Shinella sp. CPCC 101442]|uniref:hypothetical protein n=1 Tax=Shinella sp. CPCC 101442 TaxID=2932265 RepID=UPI0021523E88|nr:hypothetical protein [Shinella sp. CPCC 101442]MCR6500928.1 hypothetical protein [Shinella sp. CPCC 101442]
MANAENKGRNTKASLADLSGIKISPFDKNRISVTDPAIYTLTQGRYKIDFLWRPAPGKQRLFVFFSGDAQRSKRQPPVFQRWTWAEQMQGHCLFISDPSLYLSNDLGLAWYAGTEDFDPVLPIIEVVSAIAKTVGVEHRNIVSYGSSGGGFASLRFGSMMPEIAMVAINPQITIVNYHKSSVKKYLMTCWGTGDREAAQEKFAPRLDLLESVDALKGRRVIYAQNVVDIHHFIEHYRPFCLKMGVDPYILGDNDNFSRILFDDESGHKGAETPDVFSEILEKVNQLPL